MLWHVLPTFCHISSVLKTSDMVKEDHFILRNSSCIYAARGNTTISDWTCVCVKATASICLFSFRGGALTPLLPACVIWCKSFEGKKWKITGCNHMNLAGRRSRSSLSPNSLPKSPTVTSLQLITLKIQTRSAAFLTKQTILFISNAWEESMRRWELLKHNQPRYVRPCSRREVSLVLVLLSPAHVIRLHENTARLQLMLHSCPQSSLNQIGTASGIMLSYQAFGHTHSPRAGWSNLSNQLCTNTTYQTHTSAPEEKIRQSNLFGQKVCASCDQMRRSTGSLLIWEVCRRWRSRCPRAVFGWAHFFSPSHKDRSHLVHNPCQLSLDFFFLREVGVCRVGLFKIAHLEIRG